VGGEIGGIKEDAKQATMNELQEEREMIDVVKEEEAEEVEESNYPCPENGSDEENVGGSARLYG
jgi:hypothetical protein